MTSEKCRYYITDGEIWNVTGAQILRRITISFGPWLWSCEKEEGSGHLGSSCKKQIPRSAPLETRGKRDDNLLSDLVKGGIVFCQSDGKTKSRKKFGLAGAAEGINPGGEDFVGGCFEVEEFDAEADARLDDANDDEGFEDLALAGQLQASAAVWRKRLA